MSEQDDEDVFAQELNNRGLPNFDKDPNIDTVYQLYTKSRADLNKYSEKTLWEFESAFEHGLNDVIQPCGYTQGVIDSFYVNCKERGDIGELIGLLRECPVYGLPDISEEIIRLLKKTRIKPVPKRVYDTEQLHKNILLEFEKINPERGQIDNAYAEIAVTSNISIENVKSVVRRARKNGWVGDFNPFGEESLNINKGSSPDNE
ncbi:hypothetical protein OAL97_04235 [Paracoccaceae bacterium]|nr:hypothetical protein [Paracoccaceae bacterium]